MPRPKNPYTHLPAFDAETGSLNVIIETPKGSRNKYKYEPQLGIFTLSKVLPAGSTFPYDFGYIPSTKGEDGDPLDVLVLMDEEAFPGCLIAARLIGVIKAEQTADGSTVRNDRLIAVAASSHDQSNIQSLDEINPRLLDEIEHFFVSYREMEGGQFQPQGRVGPRHAHRLVRQAMPIKRHAKAKKAAATSKARK
jgi:inorganic pyrophosphatase